MRISDWSSDVCSSDLLGATTVRFNFRGTGDSEGAFDECRGEADDLHAVAAWVRHQLPGDAPWLAGFSFGAVLSLRAAPPLAPDLLPHIPPQARHRDVDRVELPNLPGRLGPGDNAATVTPPAGPN